MLNYWKDKKYWYLALATTFGQSLVILILGWRWAPALVPLTAFNYFFHKTMDPRKP